MFKDTLLRAGLKAVGSLWDMKSGWRIRKKLEQLGLCRTDHVFIAKVHDLAPVTADVSKPKLHREAHITYDFRMMGMGGCPEILGLSLKAGQMRCSQRHCCMALCNLLQVSNYDDN